MADHFWIGTVSNNWATIGNWSATSGGLTNGTIPTNTDNAIFDVADATDCTISTGATCANLTCTGYVGTLTQSLTNFPLLGNFTAGAGMTLAGTSAIALGGNLTLASGMTATYTGTITMNATSGTKTIDADGVSYNGAITLNGVGGTFQLIDDLLYSGASVKNFTVTNGTLDVNGKILRCTTFLCTNSNTRAVTGAGTIEVTAASGTCWNMTVVTGLTFSFTGLVKVNSTSASGKTFVSGGQTFGSMEIAGSGAYTLTITGGPTVTGTITVSDAPKGINVTNGTTLTYGQIVGNGSSGNLITLNSSDDATTFTLTKTGGGFTSVDWWSIEHCVVSLANTFYAGANSTDAGNNTDVDFTVPPALREWAGGTGNWDATVGTKWKVPGGQAGAPIPTSVDDVIIPSGSCTTAAGNTGCKDCTVQSGATLTLSAASFTVSGDFLVESGATLAGAQRLNATENVTWSAGATVTYTGRLDFVGTAVQLFDCGGHNVNCILNPNGTGNTVRLMADVPSTSQTTVLHLLGTSTVDLNNFDITKAGFSFDANPSSILMGSGVLESIGGNGVTGWNVTSADLVVTPGTSTVRLVINGTAAKGFIGQGKTYYNLLLVRGTGSGAVEIQDSNTFNGISAENPPFTITFEAGTTQTVNSIGLSGTAGNLLTLGSMTPGLAWAIAAAGGGILSMDYVIVSDLVPPVGTTVYAGANSTDGGGNDPTRVLFEDAPLTENPFWSLLRGDD